MAGSIKDFVYTADDGTDFAIGLDESNTEAVNGATQDYVAGLGIRYRIPSNVVPRSAYYSSADGKRVIRCVALTQTIYNGLAASVPTIVDPFDPAGLATLGLVRLRPEVIKRLPKGGDTGLDDGDAT
jgi:hypothetical protein